jgi:hypothetical protein
MRRFAAWSLFALYLATWVPSVYFDQFSSEQASVWSVVWAAGFMAFAVTGLILALRVPMNPIGWLLMVGATLLGAGIAVDEVYDAPGAGPAPAPLDMIFVAGLLTLFAAFIVFPEGRYPNRWFLGAHVAAIGALLVNPLFPSEGDGAWATGLNLALPVAALAFRLIRGDGVVRRQVGAPLLAVAIGLIAIGALEMAGVGEEPGVGEALAVVAVSIITVGMPVGIGIAVTKFRLYEIDRIISRTVSYTLVVALLAALFFGLAALVGSQVSDQPLFVAGATMGAAALFNPLRRRTQVWVDRRFNRSRFDAERVMSVFAGTLRDRVDPQGVVDGWVGVVSETMQPSTVGVWVRS